MLDFVLVGACGYGDYYLDLMRRFLDETRYHLCGVVDPYAENSENLEWLRQKGVPLYDTLEAFYRERDAGLVMICSPIQFHREQAVTALGHGSAVLCEKPLCPTVADALEVRAAWKEARRPFGVGFQWSFSRAMGAVKRDILAGRFGAPKKLSTAIAWKRGDEYYDPRGWKGKLRDPQGRPIMDSIAMNANAHHLHNLLFLMGERMEDAALPEWVEGSVYRAREIESYDTCFLRGAFRNGCAFTFCATHVGEVNRNPRFRYEFERGTITFDANGDGAVRAIFRDGSEKVYGYPQSEEEIFSKIRAMLAAAEEDAPPVCGIDTALPHLKICESIAGGMEIVNFPRELLVREESPPGVHVRGLDRVMEIFYREGVPPDRQDAAWAAKPRKITL